jgi:hypothetical protein
MAETTVMQIGPEGVHQLDAAQLLAARIEAGMEMQNPNAS